MAAQPGVIGAHLQAMQNQDPDRHQHHLDMKSKLVSLCGFSPTAAGPTDIFLLQHGGTLLDPESAAAMTFKEVKDMVEAHNKSNREFGLGITMSMSTFVQALVHHYRLLRAHGDPMDLATLRADLTNLDRARIVFARDHLRQMKELESLAPGEAPEMKAGPVEFRVFLVAFTNHLSKIVGAFGIPMTYLTVPATINPANPDHVEWAQVPLFGATFNRDNSRFFQILTPIVTATKYKALLLGGTGIRGDGRRLWLKITATECGAGNTFQTLSMLRKALSLIYTGKNANLPFTDFFTKLKLYWDAEVEIGSVTLDQFKIDHVWRHIDLSDNQKLQSLIAAEVATHKLSGSISAFDDFMIASHTHIVSSEIETLAGTTALGKRNISAVTPERGGSGDEEPTMIEGVDCSEYVKHSGRIHIPGNMWENKSQGFKAAVMAHNRKQGGGRQREREPRRQRSTSRLIKQLRAENAKLKEDTTEDAGAGNDEKGGNTGASIAGRRGM